MINNIAIDVVIGMVLIYLLYSVLVTLVGEYISTKLGLRARILRVAIERMLNDGYYTSRLKKKETRKEQSQEKKKSSILKIAGYFKFRSARLKAWLALHLLTEHDHFKYSFAGRFYDYPSIKYLSRVDDGQALFALTKPSYISADFFSDTIISMLKDQSKGAADIDRITYTLKYNTQHIQPQTLKIFRNMFSLANGDLAVFKVSLIKWYNETMSRSKGWFKRKLQVMLFFLGFLIASGFNVDSIRIAHTLAKDKDAREKLVNMSIRLSKDSTRYGGALQHKKDSTKGKTIVDTAFKHVTQDIGSANTILGIGWNYDTLRKNDSYKIAPGDPAYKYAAGGIARYQADLEWCKAQQNLIALRNDSLSEMNDMLSQDSSILKILKLQTADSSTIRQKMATRVKERAVLLIHLKMDAASLHRKLKAVDTYGAHLLPWKFVQVYTVKRQGTNILVDGSRKLSWDEKLVAFFSNTVYHFWGLLLTALALSMGAPFWFGLLDKLVSIRGSGPNPDAKNGKAPDPGDGNPGSIDDTGDDGNSTNVLGIGAPASSTAETALDVLTAQLENETGIVSAELDSIGQKLLVMVSDQPTLDYISAKYSEVYQGTGSVSFPIVYQVQSVNKLFNSSCGGVIQNTAGKLGKGTLGAYLVKSGSQDVYFISCWHVLKENSSWNEAPPPGKDIISDNGKNPIGVIVAGNLTPNYDAGIVVNTVKGLDPQNSANAGDFTISKLHRALTAFDESNSTHVLISGAATPFVEAKIKRIKANPTLPYIDGNHTLYDAFSITSLDGSRCPTSQGDSGALVIDKTGAPLGMIFGGNEQCAYAIKFTGLLDQNQPFNGYTFKI